MSHTLNKKGYYMKVDDNIERNCNHYVEEKNSINNKIVPALDQMPVIQNMLSSNKMPASEQMPVSQNMTSIAQTHYSKQKSHPLNVNDTKIPAKDKTPSRYHKNPPLPFNDTKIPSKYHILASDHKRPTLPVNDTNMPADEQMPDNNQKSGNQSSYNTAEQLI